ncbi:hypothetical protein Kpol_1008p4 [Vanderwaltozyma polyspora DSM 70294]|uniref:CAAX prenyl protease n=1 Tax=Vanderwaltozyma polyspora (strain ATCC 22028 / DSM 70294 / BCRC 21397 / CBS 2163 / NBRC 10782 / NRRL Y-8283 / UCD 57-17) TaxID=436907 RepID=A7TPX0_VANPO|nr:uncharacterized protein Kpol_1008p4 [Vanderwaltozyma polyspora DSM 70294]EDO15668.1 hypothetical protein Kpol_1008p4 [Vanderwaltozyma polyspora DSM 70294]
MSLFDSLQTMFENPNIPWKSIIIAFSVGQFAFESYLTLRQYNVLSSKKLPPVLQNEVDNETFEKSEKYAKAKAKFSIFTDIFALTQKLIFINYDLFPRLWNFGVQLTHYLPERFVAVSAIPQSLVFLCVLSSLSTIVDMPLSYYQHFVLEEKFGFNKQTVKLWLTDIIKGNLLGVALGGPILYLFLKIFDKFETNFLWYICLFMFGIQILAMTVIPTYIMPLFNKFTPLEDGELKTSIENLAKKVDFPLNEIYVVDGSKRSSHSNAYFTGLPFTSKRIVLYDTLVNVSSVEEITAVLAHEIGHWKKNHIIEMLVFSQVHIFAIFTLFTGVYRNVSFYKDFGFSVGNVDSSLLSSTSKVFTSQFPIIIGFMLFNDLLTPMECGMQFVINLLSRHNEYEADQYAKNLGHSEKLCSSLISLEMKNLATMNVDPLYSKYHYSHPHLAERLTALGYVSEKKKE